MANKKNTKSKSKTSKARRIAKPTISQTVNTKVIAAALSSLNQPIFLKVCRLCESKDGPFLNIFDSEKVTAKKIEELMPFWVAENDDLPHKICFRCSAKVEELHEFVQRCIRTQENLRKALGKNEPLQVKTKTRTIWEEKLNRSNMSNDDICDALIKKAMEGIKDIPKKPPLVKSESTRTSSRLSKVADLKPDSQKTQNVKSKENSEDEEDVALNSIRSSKRPTRTSTTTTTSTIETTPEKSRSLPNESHNQETPQSGKTIKEQITPKTSPPNEHKPKENENKSDDSTQKPNNTVNKEETSETSKEIAPKSFNIMDHVSMIKVNGVGILFQCKLCNRNFLKKEVVMSHACAKTGVPKLDICNMYMPPEPPKITTVKYINTKVGGDTAGDQKHSSSDNTVKTNTTPTVKRRIGPASKIGRRAETSYTNSDNQDTSKGSNGSVISTKDPNVDVQGSMSVKPAACHLPAVPNLNMRYKLLPGPNNTFTLIEDKSLTEERAESERELVKKNDPAEVINLEDSPENCFKASSRLKKTTNIKEPTRSSSNEQNSEPESTEEQPYPVGLFQTMPHHSNSFGQSNADQASFTTPTMKKQSYTVVQTGNPSKLLISTKPQQEETKKRPKRARPAPKNNSDNAEPFSVILEDTAPPKDPGFFSFINVDPLLQPSYVLPTDNIIQESQITTSTLAKRETEKDKDNKYTCNLCGEKFNREKKLNTHVYSHYKYEDDFQEETSRKRSRK